MSEIICRRKLDEQYGNEFICACPLCQQARGEEDEPGSPSRGQEC